MANPNAISKLEYRPEIDGLRAIAVGAVVLYHAKIDFPGASFLPGGFIGVDVFFVISGYLIASILLREMRDGTFRFSKFYERRARRILPPLFVVMLASLPLAWKYLLPKALKEFAGSVLSALVFGANVWFSTEDSYRAEPSALKPFLHTWSLSVEEQFYVFFPAALLILWKLARDRVTLVLLSVRLASLGVAHFSNVGNSNETFYLLHARAWELLAGAMLASIELRYPEQSSSPMRSAMTGLGLLLIVGSFFAFNDKTPHPSVLTVLPIAGAMS